jgi:long-chain acyl-CoA synthetase
VPDSAFVRDPRNFADLVRRAAEGRLAERTALLWQGRADTWGELSGRVDATARGLRELELPGTGGYPARVAIALPNVPEFAQVFFGVLRAGLIAVPLNPGYTGRELRHLLVDSGASVLVATSGVLAAVAELPDPPAVRHRYRFGGGPAAGGGPAVAPLAELTGSGPQPAGGDPVEPGTGGEDVAVLLYTSGTEGNPKGAMLTHRALLANHAQLAAVRPAPIGPDDVLLLALPLFHAYGLGTCLGGLAYHGATGVLMERFDPVESLRLIAAHRITAVVGVPPMFLAWSLLPEAAEAFASVRLAVCGAAPLDPTTARRFLEATGRPVFEGYGLTETAPVLTSTLASPVPKAGSIGRPIPDVEIKLVNADGEEVAVSVDGALVEVDDFDDEAPGSPGTDPGEIVARGANLFSGYWPDGRDGPDPAGWWPTGDVAYADADGDLFLVDRLRELILVSGFNVYPYEVEQVLAAHPAVAEAAVVGVPNPYTGQSVKAFVVTRAPVSTEELIAHCERNLARFKCPSAIEFMSSLPHSPTGKVRKAELGA